MIFVRVILFPFSVLYGLMMSVRNFLFDKNILSTTKVNAKVISIGNLSTGGTGKTPHVEFLANVLSQHFKTAILLRGYGRNTKGFLKVTSNTKVEHAGDEAINYITKLDKKVTVAVCEDRVNGANLLLENEPNLELIILDDAYQHRYIYRDCNILLTEFNHPFFKDFVLPSGGLREFRSGKNRAAIVLVTKSPAKLTTEQEIEFKSRLNVKKETTVFFSSIKYGNIVKFLTNEIITAPKSILLITGIGNPQPLKEHLENYSEVTHLKFSDHYNYTVKDIEKIHKIFDNFATSEKIIVTTEKDKMRILNSELSSIVKSYPWNFQEMTIEIKNKEQFINKVYGIIKSN